MDCELLGVPQLFHLFTLAHTSLFNLLRRNENLISTQKPTHPRFIVFFQLSLRYAPPSFMSLDYEVFYVLFPGCCALVFVF